jgi:hypothetical protein
MAKKGLFVHNLDPKIFAQQIRSMSFYINVSAFTDITFEKLGEPITPFVVFQGSLVLGSQKLED